jgi:hypothetical protein
MAGADFRGPHSGTERAKIRGRILEPAPSNDVVQRAPTDGWGFRHPQDLASAE